MKKVQAEFHPKILREARLLRIDRYGDYIFTTDCGLWSISPEMLSGISKRDLNAIGTLTRFTSCGRDKYQWQEDMGSEDEQPINKITKQPVKNELSRGLITGKSILKKLLK